MPPGQPTRGRNLAAYSRESQVIASIVVGRCFGSRARWGNLALMALGPLNRDLLLAGLDLRRIAAGAPDPLLDVLDTVDSTNDVAWRRLGLDRADGYVVFAELQTRGRGRFGRCWESPRGASVLMSVLLAAPSANADEPALLGACLGLAAAVAAHDAIADAVGVQVEIQWPNDLLYGGRKIGGVLVESRPAAAHPAGTSGRSAASAHVVGIGINCLQQAGHFPPELRTRASSLDMCCSHPIDRTALARSLLAHLDRWLASPAALSSESVRQAWLQRATPLGARIRLQHGGRVFEGHVVDLDPTSCLLVQLDDGQRRLFDAATSTVLTV